MGLLARAWQWLAATEGGNAPSAVDNYWYRPVGQESATGVRVTPEMAMRLSAVYACGRIISRTIAAMPLKIYQQLDRGAQPVPMHPLYPLLARRPNPRQTAFEFRELMQWHLCFRGNAYAEIVPGPRGPNYGALNPIHPDRVTPVIKTDGSIAYEVLQPNGTKETLVQSEMFHLRGLSNDGLKGLSPISDFCIDTVGVALAAQETVGRSYKQGNMLSGVLSSPYKINDTAYEHMVQSWKDAYSGVRNAGKVAILEQDTKFTAVSVSSKDAELLASRRWHVTDIARIFNMPPHKIADMSAATYSNIEHQALEFLQDCMMPWIVQWEQTIARDLILESEQDSIFAKFNVDAMQRADIKTRFESYSLAIQNEVMNPNEAREKEDMNPYEGGDEYRNRMVNPQQTPATGAAGRQAQHRPADLRLLKFREVNAAHYREAA